MIKFKLLKPIISIFVIFHFSGSLMANESNGVACRSGTTIQYSNRVLKCYKTSTKTFRLGSMCPPATSPQNIVMKSKGRDSCLPIGSGNRVASAATPPLFGYPNIHQFRRVISRNGVDKFIAKRTTRTYHHPRGNTYFHNAKKGVTCPSGYTSKYRYGRLKCEKKIVKRAACGGAYRLEVRSGRDLCVIYTMFGKMIGNYTIPEGSFGGGAGGNPSNYGWQLNIRSGRDQWIKTKYKYPRGR